MWYGRAGGVSCHAMLCHARLCSWLLGGHTGYKTSGSRSLNEFDPRWGKAGAGPTRLTARYLQTTAAGASRRFGSQGRSLWITSIPNVCHISFQRKQNIYTNPGSPGGHPAIAGWKRLQYCKPRGARAEGISTGLQNKPCEWLAAAAARWRAPGQTVPDGCLCRGMRRCWAGSWLRMRIQGGMAAGDILLQAALSKFLAYLSREDFPRSQCPIQPTKNETPKLGSSGCVCGQRLSLRPHQCHFLTYLQESVWKPEKHRVAEAGRAPWGPSGLTPSQQGCPELVASWSWSLFPFTATSDQVSPRRAALGSERARRLFYTGSTAQQDLCESVRGNQNITRLFQLLLPV